MAEKKQTNALGGLSKKSVAAPTKQTMNFVHHKSSVNVPRLIIVILVILIALAAIVKFGILDQEAKKTAAYTELAGKQEQLAEINKKLEDYDALAAEYGRYSYGWLNESEQSLVNRMDVIKLLDKYVIPVATVENYALSDNVLTLNIHGVTLQHASVIVKQLESNDLVESAAVYSASAEEAAEASIFMSIVLTKEAAEE